MSALSMARAWKGSGMQGTDCTVGMVDGPIDGSLLPRLEVLTPLWESSSAARESWAWTASATADRTGMSLSSQLRSSA